MRYTCLHVCPFVIRWRRLIHGHLNFEHTSPLVAVRIPEDRAVERLSATESVDRSRPNLMDGRFEIRLRCPPIPGIGTVGYLELRRLPALAAVERHQHRLQTCRAIVVCDAADRHCTSF